MRAPCADIVGGRGTICRSYQPVGHHVLVISVSWAPCAGHGSACVTSYVGHVRGTSRVVHDSGDIVCFPGPLLNVKANFYNCFC